MLRSVLGAWLLVAACSVDSRPIVPGDSGLDAAVDGRRADTSPSCVPAPEACNGRDDDCDGSTDETFDLASDPAHCGTCNAACPTAPANGRYACEAGACALSCDASFGDCDGREGNGCETPLTTAASCGACGIACEGSTPFCAMRGGGPRCVSMCDPPMTTCPSGGCVDTRVDVTNCGSCGASCPSPPNTTAQCRGSRCSFSCDPGFDDCNGDPDDGCETPLDTVDDCGRCANRCDRPGTVPACVSGACEYGCAPGLGDCDGAPGNGCEQTLDTVAHCGACGAACAFPGAVAACTSGGCAIDRCDPNRADCDSDAANGCEADLTAPATCGSCTSACGSGETCSGGRCCPSGATCVIGCGMADPCTCNSGDDCVYTCDAYCDVRCQDVGTTCDVHANPADDASLYCQSGADCTFDARGAADVILECQNNNSRCTIDCRGTTSCAVDCRSSAECEIVCDPGDTDCRFTTCPTVNDCGGGRFRCGYAC